MASFFDVLKIKKSFEMGTLEEDLLNAKSLCHKNNTIAILSAIYTQQVKQAAFTPEVAARWCVSHYINISDEELTYYLLNDYEFYVLLQSDGNGKSREAVNILKDLPPELSAFLDKYRPLYKTKKDEIKDGRKDETFWKQYWKDFYPVAASVYAKINNISKSKTIIGYTLEETLANKFSSSFGKDFFSNILEEELSDVWSILTSDYNFGTIEKGDFLRNVIGKKYRDIPTSIIVDLEDKKRPFDTMEWKLIKYQLKQNDPINENVYKLIKRYEDIQAILEDGDFLDGLNLGDALQIGLIQRAIKSGGNGLDELYTEHGWKSADEMSEIADKYREQWFSAEEIKKMGKLSQK